MISNILPYIKVGNIRIVINPEHGTYILIPLFHIADWKDHIAQYIHVDSKDNLFFLCDDDYVNLKINPDKEAGSAIYTT